MEAVLVIQGGSWHWNMLWKRLDKNNRILPAVFKEVCLRLIKDSDLCGLHQKKQILCFLNNGAFQRGCNVQHPQQRARNKFGRINKSQKKEKQVWQLSLVSSVINLTSWTLVLFLTQNTEGLRQILRSCVIFHNAKPPCFGSTCTLL